MGLMLQVTWQSMNLFIIAVAVLVPGSSGFSEPLLLESSSTVPSIEAQVPNSIHERGQLQNGSIVQPPILSPSSKSPPGHLIIQGLPTFLSPRQLTTLPTQNNVATFSTAPRHGSAPSSSVEPPNYSAFPAAKAPQDSTLPPVDKLSHDLAMPLSMAPSTEPPHASAVSPSANPLVALPQLPTAKSPETLPIASSSPPPKDAAESPQISTPNTVLAPSHALLQPVVAKPPHSSALPLAANPPYLEPPLPVAETPLASFVSPTAMPPMTIPQLPIAESPKDLPLASPLSPPEVSHHASTMLSPPIPLAESPVNLNPPTALAPLHASSHPPSAKSPHSSALPLAAKPPDPNPSLPVADSPRASASKPPGVVPQLPTAEPPEAPPLESPPPVEVLQHSSTMQSPPIPAAEPPDISTPPNVLGPSHASPQPPVPKPPHSSSLPLAANPPETEPPLPAVEPPQGLNFTPPTEPSPGLPLLPPATPPQPSDKQSPPGSLNAPSPPPQIGTLNASSPLPQPVPPYQSSPTPQLAPPFTLPPLPQAAPPYTLPPPPQLILPHPPPTSTVHSNASVLPPSMAPPSPEPPKTLPSSFPPLPPVVSPPLPHLIPPIVSFPPPLLIPSPMSPPDSVLRPPTNLPSPSPPLPPVVSPPLPQLIPPIVSLPPPLLIPPPMSPPDYVLPPPTNLPSPSPPLPPVVSPPLPQLIPPIVSFPPPLLIPPPMSPPDSVLPPPTTLPSPSPPQPPIVSPPSPQLMPPIVSSPPPLLIQPPGSPNSFLPSNASVPPPVMLPPPDLPSPFPAAPPHASAMLTPPTSHASSPQPQLAPPSLSPPFVLSAPPPSELPHISPPHSSIVSGAVPPHASPPSPFFNLPLVPVSPAIPSRPLSSPPPSKPLHSSVPPSPVKQRTVPAAPPLSSHRKETHKGAPPPSLTSPKQSPSSSTMPEGAPPAHLVTPRSLPPSSHQAEAPKHAPFLRSNSSGRAPEQSPEDKLSPRHAPSEPEFERHNATSPTPFSFGVHPAENGSYHSLRHSPVEGSPTAIVPLSSPPEMDNFTPAPSPLQRASPGLSGFPFLSPKISPSGSSTRKTKRPLAPPIRSLPPPPPNSDCAYLTCPEPFTNTPPGSPCGCVWPMQVGLRLSVALYIFFPLVSELAREIAAGVFMKQSQVRVMGANAASLESDKTIVLVDLVPLDEKFDNITAFLTFQRFWHKQVAIDKSIFGDYDVLYVRYPGLPASPPMAPADIAVINGMPYSVRDPNQSKVHPLGVDVTKRRHKHILSGIVIAAIVFSAIVCVLIFCSVAWFLVFRRINPESEPAQTPHALPSLPRSSVPAGNSTGSGPSSSLSIGSSLATYNGSAKTFTAIEMEKATDSFSPSRIVGEGGFGLVYSGILEDKTSVAVKVLKRDDQQGGREFMAEVEMLSRLHHRNLVKLIGICTDERIRCLVYELIPNGSVESHLHGPDKENAPLDWASRMKIALGAARGLAYLHEDSSPRVIHRDFKSSNILLENDFTPKVSDFGLARSAIDENNQHISTRVMGTFGYVAPEYAMTGHLLVKSDVYSYGVVLLELLTGRKPVDMLQPPGQENLATWTRPFLTTKEGLELILDPTLGSDVPLDSAAKVAAIASMCVQSEVSHRPFMGEVVQALKLVCDECDESKDGNSRHGSHESLSADFDDKASQISETREYLPTQLSLPNYHSTFDVEKGLSVSENFSASVMTSGQTSDSFRRHSASGPLKTVKGRHFWQRIRRSSNGSVSEHGAMYRLWAGSH